VFLEVSIVDVTLDDTTKFGVEFDWLSSSKNPDGSSKQSVSNNLGLADLTTGLKYKVISDSLQSLLHTLETRSNVKVYSNPSIMLVDNVKAKISIGQNVPYVTAEINANDNVTRTVAYQTVAVALTVTPHINETSDWISMDVLQTINEVIGHEGDLDSPVIADRQVETTLSVKNGQTIVIGGIIKENHEKLTKGVPLLSQIPLVGELFKSHSNRGARSELMVFLTPRVIQDEMDVDTVTNSAKRAISSKPKDPIKDAGG
jgi:general secretion pathway protein D